MSVMHNGFLRTMKAHYRINAGDVSVIRPMAYCRESLMTEFAKATNLPVINENCPACFEEPKERARIKKLLSREETLYPNLYDNIRRSLIPLMHDDMTSIMRSYLEDTLAKSRKEDGKGIKMKKRRDNENDTGDMKEANMQDAKDQAKPPPAAPAPAADATATSGKLLVDASEEDLIAELARRKAEKFKWNGASPDNKRISGAGSGPDKKYHDHMDPTGQVCSLNGGDDSIPCRELMA